MDDQAPGTPAPYTRCLDRPGGYPQPTHHGRDQETPSMSDQILVTGATGQLGAAAIHHPLTKAAPGQVVALVRDAAKATPPQGKGTEIRTGS